MMGVLPKDIGKLVVAKTAQGAYHAVGRMVAYSDHPTILLKGAHGSQTNWAAHLCEVVDMPERAIADLLHDKETPGPR